NRRIQSTSGKDLIKLNVEGEARRLRLYNRHIINLATDYIWDELSTPSQRNRFINIANNLNRINNNDTLNQIARLTTPQVTNDPFENDFFNGTSFHDSNNSLDYLILPAGCSGF